MAGQPVTSLCHTCRSAVICGWGGSGGGEAQGEAPLRSVHRHHPHLQHLWS